VKNCPVLFVKVVLKKLSSKTLGKTPRLARKFTQEYFFKEQFLKSKTVSLVAALTV
jgi:hypothetical protein